ncbi:unnamed protein product, partial [marine sediment metagenome]
LTRRQIDDIIKGRLSDLAWDSAGGTVSTKITEAWHREGDFWD